MKRHITTIIAVALLISGGAAGRSRADDLARLRAVAQQYRFALEVEKPKHKFLYVNNRNRLFVYRVSPEGKLKLDWENTNLGAPATSLIVTDVYGDGVPKLTVATARGRILVYDFDSYDLEYENINDDYGAVTAMAIAHLDDDASQEFVILGDETLYIVDASSHSIEWSSGDAFKASWIEVANVDDDEQLEIVLNTGKVIDSRFYNIEFETQEPFGDRILLMDVNGDGHIDVFGEFNNGGLKVFDLYAQREMW